MTLQEPKKTDTDMYIYTHTNINVNVDRMFTQPTRGSPHCELVEVDVLGHTFRA